MTGNTKGEVASSIPSSMVNVFVPTTPNPTSGFLLFCPREDIIFLKMTVEQAVKMVVSAGIVTPPDLSQSSKLVPSGVAKTYTVKKSPPKKVTPKKTTSKKVVTKNVARKRATAKKRL